MINIKSDRVFNKVTKTGLVIAFSALALEFLAAIPELIAAALNNDKLVRDFYAFGVAGMLPLVFIGLIITIVGMVRTML